MVESEETLEKLRKIEAYNTGESLLTEITFNFYQTLEHIQEGKEKDAISEEDYEEIKKEFEKLEEKLVSKGIIEE